MRARAAVRHRRPARGSQGRPPRERVVQDVEVPIERMRASSWTGSCARCRSSRSGCARCGCASDAARWPLYPLAPGRDLRQRRLLVDGAGRPDRRAGATNRLIERKVTRARRAQVAVLRLVLLPARSSTSSTAATRTATSSSGTTPIPDCSTSTRRRCNGDDHIQGRHATPDGCRRPSRTGSSVHRRDARDRRRRPAAAALHRLRRQLGRARRRAVRAATCGRRAATTYLATAPGDLGLARAYVAGDLEIHGVHPGDPYELLKALADAALPAPAGAPLASIARSLGFEHLPRSPRRRRRRCRAGAASPKGCGTPRPATPRRSTTTTTSRTRFYERVLGPSMTYTCACYPDAAATLEEAQENKYRLVFDKLRPEAGRPAARHRLRLGRHGAVRRPPRRPGARRDAVARAGRVGAAGDRRRGPGRPGRGAAQRLPRRHRDRVRRGVSIGLTEHIGVRNYPAYFGSWTGCAPVGCCSTTASPVRQQAAAVGAGGRSSGPWLRYRSTRPSRSMRTS